MSGRRPRRPASSYEDSARGSVRYVPVTLGGELIGYLWAANTEQAAGFVRRLKGPRAALRAPLLWSERLDAAATGGLEPLEALRKWRGAPEHAEGGGVPADAAEEEAKSVDELTERLNPDWVDPLKDFFAKEPTWPDGTPIDRRKAWEPLGPMQVPATDYPASTDGPVRYYPVVLQGKVVGYLWASVADDAAYWQDRADAGALGYNAGVPWVLRLREAAREGLTPLQALRKWKGAPEDPRGGAIPADAEEREAPSLRALQELTGDYATSTDEPVRYYPVRLRGRTVGYLWASVDAASYLARPDAGADGENARTVWERRLHEAAKEALIPLQALRKWCGAPEDPRGGAIPDEVEEQEAPGLQALEDLANE
ncbi:hypothetical protein BZB76_3229 [Actinomadura pelletieri DSM 43383]|uniref:Uncharacterized protein n=1 Tax=Actinomadura pelletieri DSM 43383 TaxID=1120940 RepID=A0A495QPA9_9ACTN|nr:hypothetical protein [Actinomadura pelletieri]RKS74712.1 hypothetical protein BZB76_3229 [Actinomadura pelletieri DSM 43383]